MCGTHPMRAERHVRLGVSRIPQPHTTMHTTDVQTSMQTKVVSVWVNIELVISGYLIGK